MAADGGRHPLVEGCPPEWASGWGEDVFGVFVEFRVGAVEQRMRWIRPGQFIRQHPVTLTRGYWLADTPVTQALWEAVLGENPSKFQGDTQRPVEQVSWHDCQRLCVRLGERVAGPAFRLPTEAEWEYACRAGTTEATYAEALKQKLDDIAWYSDNSQMKTHAVKAKLANQWGLHDMLGNVWEWCSDWYSSDSSAAQQDPAGPATGGSRVVRGGSWGADAGYVRAASRGRLAPGDRYGDLGLRLVRDQ